MDESKLPGDLTCDDASLNLFLRWYHDASNPNNGKPHGTNGTIVLRRNLRNFFKWVEKETGAPNPITAGEVNLYVPRKTRPKVLPVTFLRELIDSCRPTGKKRTFTDYRDEALIGCLLEGMRAAEVLSMAPEDVPPLDNPIITVTPKKGARQWDDESGRQIWLEIDTVRALHAYLRVRAEHPLADEHPGRLWLGNSPLPLEYNGLRLMLTRRCKRLGYGDHATSHMFRHTFSHLFLDNGGSLNDLGEHNG
ncbi:tyrosine-type recombinase/integrase [Actinomadura barringtoniae]|uniref:Tyrosine-type recombinase/integrase n=1 Tax=Actinomadura barringtoniae TaxID=1427535 RepID=A0A939PB63_9ACTN|nr:site-specific integrase [Actinomadura barringtoniae]MBO2446384.1 tyrosine-type recombinase/integrase [Actinomadura barringtoniae]